MLLCLRSLLLLSIRFGLVAASDLNLPAREGRVLIPVFADVHGRITALFRATSAAQKRSGHALPVVLVAGDLGYFPYPGDLDEPLRRREIKSEVDHGFSNFLRREEPDTFPPPARYFFVRGNHEDHELLKDREWNGEAVHAVDRRGIFNYLADGTVFRLITDGNEVLRIGAFGGIHRDTRPGRTADNPLMVFDDEAADRLLTLAGTIDILLTHQGPQATLGGHPEIDTLIHLIQPRLHLHGHAGVPQASQRLGSTRTTCVPQLVNPRAPAFAIEWIPADHSLNLVEI